MGEGYIGGRVRRVEDPRLIQGQGQYVGDLLLPGMLHAGFVRSPHAHARIRSVDLSAARAMPGVVAAYGYDDLPELTAIAPTAAMPPQLEPKDIYPLARDTVRYVGEAVAVVLVDHPYLLEDALEAVSVEFDELPAVVDPEEALHGQVQIWEELPGNVALRMSMGFGDVEALIGEADVVVEERIVFARAAGAAMEPRAVAAAPGEGETALTIWDSTQAPHSVRDSVAGYLGLDPERVRVIAPDVGGGFGVKGRVYAEEYVVPALALRHNRPVCFVATRTEDLMTTAHGRAQVHHVRLAARADGTILALHDRLIQDVGAYTPSGVIVPLSSATHLMGPYRVPALHAEITAVYTNAVMISPLRGGGRPQGIYVMERMLDRLAQRLDMDRAEVRRRNLIPPDAFPYDTGMPGMRGTVVYDSGDYPAYLERALEEIGYNDFRREQEEARGKGRYLGLGLVAFIESTGLAMEGARVEVREDGRVRVFLGSPSQGQGHATAFAQIAAQRLGASLERVQVISGDTQAFGSGIGTFGSRMGQLGGNAVSMAAQAVRERALRLASDLLEIAPDDLEIAGGRIAVRGMPERSIDLAEVARRSIERGEPLAETRTFSPQPATTYAGGVNAAIVEVDVETGKVEVLRYLVVHDSGTVINPTIVEGQVHGGVVHGLGNALHEAFLYSDDGQPLTATLADYAIPQTADSPLLEIVHFESPSPFNPEGIKGAGEGGTIAAIPTIVSAVEDALSPFGITLTDVPIRADDIARRVAHRGPLPS